MLALARLLRFPRASSCDRLLWPALAATLLVAACARDAPPSPGASPTPKRSYEKTDLLRLPSTVKNNSLVFSDDGATFAYFVSDGEGVAHMVTPAGPHGPHAEVGRPTFAPHTHRLFYWEVDASIAGKQHTINADGLEVPTPYAKPGVLAFGDTGGHWAAIGFEAGDTPDVAGAFHVLGEGGELGRYDDVGIPAVSRDGHVAYVARSGADVALFVDGLERRAFAPPSAPCPRAAVRDLKGPQLSRYPSVHYFSDGSVLVLARDADGWAIFHDDVRLASYPTSNVDPDDDACKSGAKLAHGSIRKADEAPVAAWFERLPGDEERWRTVRNGAPVDDTLCTAPWRRQPPELSADGAHVAYACASKIGDEKDLALVVKDGARYGPYREVWGLALSKNGAHVSYGATTDTTSDRPWAIYVDGEQRTARYSSTWRPLVFDDGKTVAWETKNADGPRGMLGIGARRLASFDAILWGPESSADARVSWIIRRGRTISRVTIPIEAAEAGR